MAIVQISQITNRKGRAENLPQLAGAELGWSTDSRQLWIGNGTLAEGAPVVGNTEILTEFSNILNFATAYTYEGKAAGYTVQTGPTADDPVTLSLQSWLDQFASVLDFGAVGDGSTDCTAAINRALYQLYCRESNPQIRRSLFFPAGVYKVTGTINIPPYATLYGEGIDNSVIQLAEAGGAVGYVAQTADSNQNTGVNIGSGGATPPEYITVNNLGFRSTDPLSSAFLVGQATNCRFQNVGFTGPGTTATLTSDAAGTMGVEFASTSSYVCDQIVFDGCQFSGTTWASYSDQQLKGIVFSNSKMHTLYCGFEFGTGTVLNGGATGVRIMHNLFDTIYSQGIIYGSVSLNASGYNIFYNTGNHFQGSGFPATTIIEIQNNNNISISDMFDRNDADALVYPRINLNNTVSIATTNGAELQMGTLIRESGTKQTLINNNTGTVFDIIIDNISAFAVDYTISRAPTGIRTGTISVVTNPLFYSDDYIDNSDTGITLYWTQVGDTLTLNYTATDEGENATISYSITYFS